MTTQFGRRIYLDHGAGKGRRVAGYGKRRSPALLYWIVSPTAALCKIPIRYLLDAIPRELIERVYESENLIWLKPDILVEFKSAERPDLLVAAEVDGMLVDEACRVKGTTWSSSLRSRLTSTRGWALFATSPLGRQNWVYKELVAKAGTVVRWVDGELAIDHPDGGDMEIESISWPTVANPKPEIQADIEPARRQLPERYFKRDYLASWDSFTGTIYETFNEKTHVVTEGQLRFEYGLGTRPIRSLFKRIIGAIDWGWTSPGCILVAGDTGRDIILLEEVYAPYKKVFDPYANDTWIDEAKRLRLKWGVQMFYADPEDPRSIDDMQRSGVPITTANNEVNYGIRKTSEQMTLVNGKPRLRVMDTCKNFIREVKAYQWAENKATKAGGEFSEMPADGQSDHSLDCARYLVVELREYEQPRQEYDRPVLARGPVM